MEKRHRTRENGQDFGECHSVYWLANESESHKQWQHRKIMKQLVTKIQQVASLHLNCTIAMAILRHNLPTLTNIKWLWLECTETLVTCDSQVRIHFLCSIFVCLFVRFFARQQSNSRKSEGNRQNLNETKITVLFLLLRKGNDKLNAKQQQKAIINNIHMHRNSSVVYFIFILCYGSTLTTCQTKKKHSTLSFHISKLSSAAHQKVKTLLCPKLNRKSQNLKYNFIRSTHFHGDRFLHDT